MITEIAFSKVSGAGNDFIIVDNRDARFPLGDSAIVRKLCSRYFGIGADGVLLLEQSSRADFAMRYFNSDGSYGGMCGNGGRCIARYAFVHGIVSDQMSFDALDFVYRAEILGDHVKLTMKDPTDFRTNISFTIGGQNHKGFFINTGSPHYVEFVDNVAAVPVEELGRLIRSNVGLFPDGTNANFVQIVNAEAIKLRTYERGVEAETLACGTGAVASGLVAHLHQHIKLPVTIHVKSGELLTVNSTIEQTGKLKCPTLQGSAHILFTGRVLYDTIKASIVDHTG